MKINAFIVIGKTNMMTEEDAKVVKLALDMYDDFFNQLTTAISNTLKNWTGAMLYAEDPRTGLYMRGKVDAFKEFLDRLEKERDLAKQEYQALLDHEEFRSVHESIHFHKNNEVDKLLPNDKYRGRGPLEWQIFHRFKGRIADLLEGYAQEGFNTGIRYMKKTQIDKELHGEPVKFDREELEKILTTQPTESPDEIF